MSMPFVSVLVVVRNEGHYIRECLDRLQRQDYQADRYEVLVLDGLSEDGTREIVAEFAAGDARFQLVENVRRRYSAGLNLGIAIARGEYLIKVDGHSFVEPGFIRLSIETALRTGADVTGGRIRTVGGETRVSQAIALVLSSPFGVGDAKFRYSDRPGWAETVPYGCYRREAFERVGLFDEGKNRTEDLDLHARIRRTGGRIYFNPEIETTYLSRRTVAAMCRQAFNSGFEVLGSLSTVRVRHLVPFLFLLGLLAGPILLSHAWTAAVWLLCVGLYLCLDLLFSGRLALRHGAWLFPFLTALFPVLHLAYGAGTLLRGLRMIVPVARETGQPGSVDA